MRHIVESALRLFSPKGFFHLSRTSATSDLGREEVLGALQFAAKDNPLGLAYLMADHLLDERAIDQLQAHFITTLGGEEITVMALAILLRRPLPSQLARLVLLHPYYDKERRRAAVIMVQAKRAHRARNEREYQRLLDERNALLQAARSRCAAILLQTGRCPRCGGTGRRIRLNTECSTCQGSGRITPDITLVSRRFGFEAQCQVEKVIDEVLGQASALAHTMQEQVRLMSV